MKGSKIIKSLGKFFVISFVILVIGFINAAIYPFRSQHPNFSDVERVFGKMQFPSDWQQINESENRGIGGRQCPIESESLCYHKGERFKIPANTPQTALEKIFKQAGCPVVAASRSEPIGGAPYTNFRCSTEGLSLTGGVNETSQTDWEASFYVNSY